jgi:hypothetical protein
VVAQGDLLSVVLANGNTSRHCKARQKKLGGLLSATVPPELTVSKYVSVGENAVEVEASLVSQAAKGQVFTSSFVVVEGKRSA